MNERRAYDMDPAVAELYDRVESHEDDVALLRRLIGGDRLRIFEPFFGTGRIGLPLARDGHEVEGMERAAPMAARARSKMAAAPCDVRARIRLTEGDVLETEWPRGVDLVLLGGNCFYELSGPEEQERCIALARRALLPGGRIFLDNNHMEGELAPSWRRPPGRPGRAFPTGVCADGTRVEGTTETLEFDIEGRWVRYRRTATVFPAEGEARAYVWEESCRPPSTAEVAGWLAMHGFDIMRHFGDRGGSPYRDDSPRSIFWARRQGDIER